MSQDVPFYIIKNKYVCNHARIKRPNSAFSTKEVCSPDLHGLNKNSDRTPERAEFENLGDASELMDQDNLLNSELDEEELTQRNLGAIEVQTDDDLEQLSSDDEDEDQELMLRAGAVQGLAADADATRHLAETWSKKHNQSCCDSDEEELTDDTTDEETSTEKDEGKLFNGIVIQ